MALARAFQSASGGGGDSFFTDSHAPERHKHLPQEHTGVDALVRYSPIRDDQLSAVHQMWDSQPVFQTVHSIACSGIFGGGILFERERHAIKDAAVKSWYERTWIRFGHEVVRHLWMYGFAAVVIEPHDEFKGIPRVLNYEHVCAAVRADIYDVRTYTFWMRSSPLGPAGAPGVSRRHSVIPGVKVYEMNPPRTDGSLRSKLATLYQDASYVSLVRALDLQAMRLRSNPALVVQRPPDRHDPDSLTFSLRPELVGGGAPGAEDRIAMSHEQAVRRNLLAEQAFAANSGLAASVDPLEFARTRDAVGPERIDLEEGATLAKQIMPETRDHISQLRIDFEQQVGGIFGVPRGMFADASSKQASDNAMNQRMFYSSQRELKRKLTKILTATFNDLYAEEFAMDHTIAIADWHYRGRYEGKPEPKDTHRATINLPGSPPIQDLQQLYLQGILKYESLVKFSAANLSISPEHFNAKPQVSVKELNGIKPEGADKEPAAKPTATNQVVEETVTTTATTSGTKGTATTQAVPPSKTVQKVVKKQNTQSNENASGTGGGAGAKAGKPKKKKQKTKR